MNKTYTLKELADIAKAAAEKANKESQEVQWGVSMSKTDRHGFIWSETVRAILDTIGYEFPKDEEREAFERWQTTVGWDLRDSTFEAWKAGREELRKESCSDKCGDAKPKEPAWIPWAGGECPLADGMIWEAKFRSGTHVKAEGLACRWDHNGSAGDIVAYRVLE